MRQTNAQPETSQSTDFKSLKSKTFLLGNVEKGTRGNKKTRAKVFLFLYVDLKSHDLKDLLPLNSRHATLTSTHLCLFDFFEPIRKALMSHEKERMRYSIHEHAHTSSHVYTNVYTDILKHEGNKGCWEIEGKLENINISDHDTNMHSTCHPSH